MGDGAPPSVRIAASVPRVGAMSATCTDVPVRTAWAPRIGVAVAVTLVVAAMAVPAIGDWNVHINTFPPIYADWAPRLGPGTAPAVLLAVLGTLYAARAATLLSWRRLLLASWVVGVLWMLALATVDGGDIGRILGIYNEYLRTARGTPDLAATLQIYVDRIPFYPSTDWPPEIAGPLVEQRAIELPYDPGSNWPAHIAGHPPGALTFFVVLVRLGLGSTFAAGMVVTLIAATTALAVMTTVRVLGSEALARTAAPFLVLGPAAIWQCVSADAVFAAVAAWGLCALAVAATRTSARALLLWSVPAGLLLGFTVMLSYGLVLVGVLALAVLWLAGSWRPLLPVAAMAAGVVLTYAAFGFAWWEGFVVLRERYWDGVASIRPPEYWTWANLAALTFCAGLLMPAGVAQAWVRRRQADPALRPVVVLTLAATAAIALADLSQMSRAEVERIWLPFVPWLLLGCALLPERWRRYGLGAQVAAALVVQHLLRSAW